MTRHAWNSYVKYAFGANELKPVSRRSHSANIFGRNTQLGATIVDSLDTLYMMGMLDEYKRARDWVVAHLDFSKLVSALFRRI